MTPFGILDGIADALMVAIRLLLRSFLWAAAIPAAALLVYGVVDFAYAVQTIESLASIDPFDPVVKHYATIAYGCGLIIALATGGVGYPGPVRASNSPVLAGSPK